MSISTLIYGSNSESRVEEIRKSLPNFKWEYNPDLKIIERTKTKKSIGIEEVRPVSNFLKIKPLGKLKIVIIKEANLLTPEAQNSLLKILEEPPEYAQIFLEGNTIESLLPTILSRCAKVKVSSDESLIPESEFFKMTLSERFDYMEALSKLEKEEVISFLTNTLKSLKKPENKIELENLNLLISTIENLSKFNINTRLALENLVVNFK